MYLGNSYAGNSKYGEYRMQFAGHKLQTATQTYRQITLTGDGEIHVREKLDQSY